MRITSIASVFLLVSVARADLPSPRFDRLTPLGAAVGSTLEVEVAGADLEEANSLLFDHPGIQATYLKDRKFRVTIAAEVPQGTHDAWLVGRFGITNPRLFAVSRGLTEISEVKPKEPETAQVVPLNCVINGLSRQGRETQFRFPGQAGQRIVIECFAQRLDSQLDGTLTLTDAEGRQLASNGDHAGRDPLVEFVPPRNGDYTVTFNDLSFRGGHPYRLVISTQPQVENIAPRAIMAGKPTPLVVYGRNLGSHARPSPLLVNELPLDELTETITAPREILERGLFRFTEHPTGSSVLPTAATCTLTGMEHRGVPLVVTDTPVSMEQEPNNDPSHAQRLPLPAVVSARFDKERDADWYTIEPPESGSYTFEVYCERIAGRADPYLVVFDEKNNRMTELDDFGIRMNAFDGHLRDPSGAVNLTGKKTYHVLVQDRYRRGGPRYQYVLAIHRAVPDFYAAAIHHQNPGPGGTTIRKGGTAYLDVILHNTGGFQGPVTITADKLPRGIHMAPTTIVNDNRGVLVFWADADASDWVGSVSLTATAKRGTETFIREVRPYTRVWSSNDPSSSRPMRQLMLAARETAPFSVTPAIERAQVQAGGKVTVTVKGIRSWPGFTGAIALTPLVFPGSIKMGTISIPEGKAEAVITIDVPANARPAEYTLVLQCQAQVPFAKDVKAMARPNTLVTVPSRPFTLTVTPAKK